MPRGKRRRKARLHEQRIKRYAELPRETKEWLEQLRKDDIERIKAAVEFQKQAHTVGRFGKWAAITLGAFIIGVSQIGDSLSKILSFFSAAKAQ